MADTIKERIASFEAMSSPPSSPKQNRIISPRRAASPAPAKPQNPSQQRNAAIIAPRPDIAESPVRPKIPESEEKKDDMPDDEKAALSTQKAALRKRRIERHRHHRPATLRMVPKEQVIQYKTTTEAKAFSPISLKAQQRIINKERKVSDADTMDEEATLTSVAQILQPLSPSSSTDADTEYSLRKQQQPQPYAPYPAHQQQQSYHAEPLTPIQDDGSQESSRPKPKKKQTEHENEQSKDDQDQAFRRTAAGVAGAAGIGCILLGPIGLLVGAAAASIGYGITQIPEEQRSKVVDKAKTSIWNASEAISNSCANTYKDSGIADSMPEMCAELPTTAEPSPKESQRETEVDQIKVLEPKVQATAVRKPKVACMRQGENLPVSEIYGLAPNLQPRAWLDVLAGADTSHSDKMEAMEEILILSKDKQRAKIFLEEGILDSIMWILDRYFEKQQPKKHWKFPETSFEERSAAKLAAKCCLTLGKAHCAAIHTEGDLLLMSLYERGTVPEERQLAQMLHEIPHHTRVTKTADPTIVDPPNEDFMLKTLSLPAAQELASAITELSRGTSSI